MPVVQIQGGAKLEIPNRKEIREELAASLDERERSRARGFKPIRVALPGPTPAGGTLYIPGPESGYIWNLKLVSVQLATNGSCLVYINSSAPVGGAVPLRLIANMNTATTSAYVTTYSSSQVLLLPDEGIYLNATQNLNSVFLAAAEVPAEMVFKAYD
jgi:hypothetical protein